MVSLNLLFCFAGRAEPIVTNNTSLFWESIWTGMIANLAVILLLLVIGQLLIKLRKSRLLRIWDLEAQKTLHIYTANMKALPDGTIDVHGVVRSFRGPVVPYAEMQEVNEVQALFYSKVSDDPQFERLTRGLLQVHAEVHVEPAPASALGIASEGTVLAIGSPGYNEVSREIERRCGGTIHFDKDNTLIVIPETKRKKPGTVHAILVQVRSGRRTWFYVAGLGSVHTLAAVYFLTHSWKEVETFFLRWESYYVAFEVDGVDFAHPRIIDCGPVPNAGFRH